MLHLIGQEVRFNYPVSKVFTKLSLISYTSDGKKNFVVNSSDVKFFSNVKISCDVLQNCIQLPKQQKTQ